MNDVRAYFRMTVLNSQSILPLDYSDCYRSCNRCRTVVSYDAVRLKMSDPSGRVGYVTSIKENQLREKKVQVKQM